MKRPRGRPPNPAPLIFWRVRLDIDPPRVCREHPELAKLLTWQVALVKEYVDEHGELVAEPLTGIRAHILEDDGTKHRFLRRFADASKSVHGYLVLESEPPASTKAIVRVRGAILDPICTVPLSNAERIDKNLHDQPAEQLAAAIFERADVREQLLKLLQQQKPEEPPGKDKRRAG